MTHRLIIMANSRKVGNRCIAGIDITTGEWIRPVRAIGDGLPSIVRQVNGREPKLLDIVEMSLDCSGPHHDIQPENRTILDGAWRNAGKASVDCVVPYCQQEGFILHNTTRSIHANSVLSLPKERKKSLCLLRADMRFYTEPYRNSRRLWAEFKHDLNCYALTVTDSEYEKEFPPDGTHEAHCLITVSLGLPFTNGYCYKFVAGVVEL